MDPALDLIEAARMASRTAYAPYSGFGVGAAILLSDGFIISSANLENASYGLSLCAEAGALAAANAAGRLHDVKEIAIIGGTIVNGAISGANIVRPCGRCRQMLNEVAQLAGVDIIVHCASADGTVTERHMLSALLPFAFGPNDLSCT